GHGGLGSGEIDSGEIGGREAIGTSETSSGETRSGEIGPGRYLLAPEPAEAAARQSLAVRCAGGAVVLAGAPAAGPDRSASHEGGHPLGWPRRRRLCPGIPYRRSSRNPAP